ncbi:MAG: hypothetical protein EOP04_20450 [Proteobacteria bacterium]|nr:MAG: hypothetical protein EOP04_20450 [Pseudomonadota bacterium]
MLDKKLIFAEPDSKETDYDTLVTFFSNPNGIPLNIIIQNTADQTAEITLITSQGIEGMLTLPMVNGKAEIVLASSLWQCEKVCIIKLVRAGPIGLTGIEFRPDDMGPKRLLKQFLVERKHSFAHPL